MQPDVSLHENLDGQVALVTGANRGLGAAIADALADLGATVYGAARRPAEVDDRHEALRMDVTDARRVAAALSELARDAKRLDVLVNNAGVYGPAGDLDTLDPGDVFETYQTNLLGPTLVARYALPVMLDRDDAPVPRVVNVSSRAGQFASGLSPGRLPYGVSKAGLNALTVSLDGQYDALLANAVCPGWVRTDMGGQDAAKSPAEGADTPVWLARFGRGSPSGLFWAEREVVEW